MSNTVKFKPKQLRAIELLASQPDMDLGEIAKESGISSFTLLKWRQESAFLEAVYDRYMQLFGGKLPGVLNAMIRESRLGNVAAARLVMEAAGKLVKRISVKVESPFEKFINLENIQDAEVVDVVSKMEITEVLPERDPINDKPKTRVTKEKKKVAKIKRSGLNPKISAKRRAENRKKSFESYHRLKRAKKVGMPPLGRLKGEEKRKWYEELEKREEELNSTN
tara:strand:+ start:239 stop:907 length:669 start_codon:yes stop_codon:yes gene_type:complete